MKQVAVSIGICILFLSCRLTDLDDSAPFSCVPDQDYQILLEGTPLTLEFSEAVNGYTVEEIVSVKDAEGKLDLLYHWTGETQLELEMVDPLVPGKLYSLVVEGEFFTTKDEIREASQRIPFFYRTDQYDPLKVLSVTPAEGAVVSDQTTLEITFNRKPDTVLLRQGFSLSPDTDYDQIWEDNTLKISPKDRWDNLTGYTLKISHDVKDPEGIPLDPELDSSFYVSAGTTVPAVTQTGPCLNDRPGAFPWLSADLNDLKKGEAIRVRFSEEMDTEEVEKVFSIAPTLSGDFYWENSQTDLVFVPSSDPVMGETYSLIIGTGALSRNGIALTREFRKDFTPAIPEILVDSIECLTGPGFLLNTYSSLIATDLPTNAVSPYDITFRFLFTRPFPTEKEKQTVQNSLSLYEVFSSSGSPRVGSFSWASDLSLTVLFTGFNAIADKEHYYVLEIKGGETGIRNEEGSYMSQTVQQLFRVDKL